MRYWIFIENRAEGPFTPDQLKRLAIFTRITLVCPEGAKGGDDWAPAINFPELDNLLRSIPKRFWVLDDMRAPKGPFDIQEIRKIQGFTPNTLACPVGSRLSEDWMPAGKIDELKPVFSGEDPSAGAMPSEAAAPGPSAEEMIAKFEAASAAGPSAQAFPSQPYEAPFEKIVRQLKEKWPLAAGALVAAIVIPTVTIKLLHRHHTPTAPAAQSQDPKSEEAIRFVQHYALSGAAAKPYPNSLYLIGDPSKERWRELKTLTDRFRYGPILQAWQFTQSLAQSRGISGDDAARLVQAKIQELHGLDSIYQVEWSATRQSEGRYRVEAKISDGMQSSLTRAAASNAPATAVAGTVEDHAFMVDLAARTLAPATPEAMADLGIGETPTAPPTPKPPKTARTRPKPTASKRRQARKPTRLARPAEPLEQPATPPPSPSEKPLSPQEATLPGMPAPASARSAPPPSNPQTAPSNPPQKVKPATEMSVDELEQYLKRK